MSRTRCIALIAHDQKKDDLADFARAHQAALARFPIPGKEAWFLLILSSMMVPYQALLVPQAAVSRTPKGQASVMLVNSNNEVEARLIETGRTVEQSWQVLSGLQAGDKVIVAGLQKIKPGAKVRVVTAAAASRQTATD